MSLFIKKTLPRIHTFQHRRVQFHTSCQLLQLLPQKTSDPFQSNFSEIIDVRTDKEFAVDHILGAKHFPVLTQEQHEHVGIQYTTDSFKARKTGAKFVSSNISQHIGNYFEDKDKDYSPLVYCKRGGQRSQSLAVVLSLIGFNVYVLEGGYRKYRQIVREQLDSLPKDLTFNVLSGLTGTGKTHLLHQLSERGQQILDLEGLAQHKGSLLGLWHDHTQPSQRYWESLLRDRLAKFHPGQPVWVESESRKIGNLAIPNGLFQKMSLGKRYKVTLPMNERVRHIIKDYPNWISDVESLTKILKILERFQGKKKVENWIVLLRENKFEEFVESILREHYDPLYTESQLKAMSSPLHVTEICLEGLDRPSVDVFVNRVTAKDSL